MKIADLDLGPRPVMLAPMEDVTDPSFRLICREMGARLVYTEFVSAEALIRNINSTTRKLHIDDRERPVAIQIYGREPDAMVEAARIAEEAGPDLLERRRRRNAPRHTKDAGHHKVCGQCRINTRYREDETRMGP